MNHILLLLAFLLPTHLFGQGISEEFTPALLQTKTGALLVYNSSARAFTVRLVGNVLPPTQEAPNFMNVDGQIIQAATVAYASNGDVTDLPEETTKKFLIGYQQHESNYFRQELKVPVANEKIAFVHLGNHLFLSWEFDTPFREKGKVTKQLYLVAICFNQALVLNCPITKPSEAEPAKALLAATAATLTLKNEPVNLNELYKQLERE